MFSKLFLGAVFASFLATKESNAEYYDAAVALFDNEDVYGYVSVFDGWVVVMLNVSELVLSEYGIPGDCYTGGMSYHIHEKWTHNTSNSMTGPTACGSGYTGGHWDPWLACGSATGNEYCGKFDEEGGCVNGSSVLGSGGYTCDYFRSNPYSCEVGDWSGKYGKVEVIDNRTIYTFNYSAYEVDAYDLINKSVVFHCSDSSRAFCAPFDYFDDVNGTIERPEQDTNLVASMGSGGFYVMYGSGINVGYVNLSAFDLSDNCGDWLYYRIFDDWDSSSYYELGSDCNDIVGYFYDPTVTCMMNSSNPFCYDGLVCNDSDYSYTCDFDEYGDRFLCAPGDLSGKFGAIRTNWTDATLIEDDELMVDLDLVAGGSIVFQCSNSWETVACGVLIEVEIDNDNVTTTWYPASSTTEDGSSEEITTTYQIQTTSYDLQTNCNYGLVGDIIPIVEGECNLCYGNCGAFQSLQVLCDSDNVAWEYEYVNYNCTGDYNVTALSGYNCSNSGIGCDDIMVYIGDYNDTSCSDLNNELIIYAVDDTICTYLNDDGFYILTMINEWYFYAGGYFLSDCSGTPFFAFYFEAGCDNGTYWFFDEVPTTTMMTTMMEGGMTTTTTTTTPPGNNDTMSVTDKSADDDAANMILNKMAMVSFIAVLFTAVFV